VADNNQRQQPTRFPADAPVESAGGAAAPFRFAQTQGANVESPFSTTFIAQLFGQLPANDDVIGSLFGEGTGVPAGFVDFSRLAEFDKVKYKPSGAFAPREKSDQQQALESTPTAPQPVELQEAPAKLDAPIEVDVNRLGTENAARDLNAPAYESSASLSDSRPLPTPQAGEGNTEAPAVDTPQAQQAEEAAVEVATSIFSSGFDAYTSAQGRAKVDAASSARSGGEVNLIS
ncbi:MAG: hypothetical protein ACPG80_03115, partial [Rickettsiales bacterium]